MNFDLNCGCCAVPILHRGTVVSCFKYTLNIVLIPKFNCPAQIFRAHTYYRPIDVCFFICFIRKKATFWAYFAFNFGSYGKYPIQWQWWRTYFNCFAQCWNSNMKTMQQKQQIIYYIQHTCEQLLGTRSNGPDVWVNMMILLYPNRTYIKTKERKRMLSADLACLGCVYAIFGLFCQNTVETPSLKHIQHTTLPICHRPVWLCGYYLKNYAS